jgi:hypothetical protein
LPDHLAFPLWRAAEAFLESAVSHAVLVITPGGDPSTPGCTAEAWASSQTLTSAVRCILVNGAQLKSEAYCAACGERIGESYVRHIGTRKTFCDFRCYRGFGDRQGLGRAPGLVDAYSTK